MKKTVITFYASKGGVSKSRHSLLTANALGMCDKKVLVLDMDPGNSSLTRYYVEENAERIRTKNIFKAMSDPENNLADYALQTNHKNVDIIPSSRFLSDLSTVSDRRLNQMMKKLDDYNIIIIDCQPLYCSLVLNAINASDFIITPVLRDSDSLESAYYLSEKLQTETDKFDNWFININGFDRRYVDAKGGKQKDLLDNYEEFYAHLTPNRCWFPWTSDMNSIKDCRMKLSATKIKGAIYNPKLYEAVMNLAECFVDEDSLSRPESF